MLSKTTKLIITLILCIGVVLAVIYNETIWNIILLGLLFGKGLIFKFLVILKKFFFKKGVVSLSTIAWKHVLVSSFFALSKRAIINTITEFFQDRIVKPLIHPLTRYLKVRWKIFKASNLWKKCYTIIFGTVPASFLLWLVGIADAVWMLMKGFSLAKFLTLILKFITVFFVFFQNLWRNWIQPYIDFIVITLLVTYIEKIPVLGALFRRTRISIKWHLRGFHHRKKRIIEKHIDQPVNMLGERIHKHVNEKKEGLKPKDTDGTLSENVNKFTEKKKQESEDKVE
ncbi:hypothetical protein EOL70_15535 [Leucothrix sargassi]|nr:hypothetical protein EOL70_15535 [Leucothrix sargassi]